MPADKMVKRIGDGRYHTPPQIELGLRAVVRNGGAVTSTARELGIPHNTVKSWLLRHQDRYKELQTEMGPELEAQAVAGFQAFVLRAEQAKIKALESTVADLQADADDARAYAEAVRGGKVDAKLPARRVRDAAKALQHISVAQGIGVQKILELTNRPTQIVEHRSMADIMARLQSLGATVIDGTAETVVSSDEPAALESGG